MGISCNKEVGKRMFGEKKKKKKKPYLSEYDSICRTLQIDRENRIHSGKLSYLQARYTRKIKIFLPGYTTLCAGTIGPNEKISRDLWVIVCLYGVFTLHGTSGYSATGPTALRDFQTTSRMNFYHQKFTSLTPQWNGRESNPRHRNGNRTPNRPHHGRADLWVMSPR